MTPQELPQLIQAIPNWQTESPVTLFAELSEATILYEDRRDWTWKGIADVINPETGTRFGREGCKKLQDALVTAGEELWVSQICAGLPLNDSEIQAVLRYLDIVGIVPGARHVANAVHRMISVLEQNNITTTVEEIAQVQASLKNEQRQQYLLTQGADVWNAFVGAVNNLQVGDSDPVLVLQFGSLPPVL